MKIICENWEKCKIDDRECMHKKWHGVFRTSCQSIPCSSEFGVKGSLCVENVFLNLVKRIIKNESSM